MLVTGLHQAPLARLLQLRTNCVITVRELQHEEAGLPAIVSRPASLASQPQLRTMRVRFHSLCVRAMVRGGGYTSECLVLSSLASKPRLRAKRVGFRPCCARALAQGDGHAGDRFASSSTSLAVFSAWNEARGSLPQLCVSLDTMGRSYRRLLRVDLPSPVKLISE